MQAVWTRFNSVMLVLVFLALTGLIAMVAARGDAGPLDPPFAPGSTMRTLDDLYDSWYRRLPANDGSAGGDFLPPPGCESSRFKCVLTHGSIAFRQYPAVLDVETGLVWEREPDTATRTWDAAHGHCLLLNKGQRLGWRVPTVNELTSLMDPLNTNQVPAGAPFVGVNGIQFWSSSESYTGFGWYAVFSSSFTVGTLGKGASLRTWCVRGDGADTAERTE